MKIKSLACFSAALIAFFSFGDWRLAHGQKSKDKRPPAELVARFDALVQQRFLEVPNFGIRRIMPVEPTSAHFETFDPRNEAETKLLAEFEEKGWRVVLYLYGRTVQPFPADHKNAGKFDINYKDNVPVRVTKGLRRSDLPVAKSLLGNIKNAFVDFQTAGIRTENEYDFNGRGWNYFARPVRASQTSCLECHTDYVITQRLVNGQFRLRKRQLGDANGVIVYAFRRK